jgi:hypothetical protein
VTKRRKERKETEKCGLFGVVDLLESMDYPALE